MAKQKKRGKKDLYRDLESLSEKEVSMVQMEKSIETFQSQNSLLVQIITVLLIANVTVVGFAIEAKSGGLWMIGIVFPLVGFLVNNTINKLMIPPIYTAICIEKRYNNISNDWLASTYINFKAKGLYKKLISISELDKYEERMEALRKLNRIEEYSIWLHATIWSFIALQIIIPTLLIKIFGWNFL